MHLMATVWEPRTETVLPDTGLSVEITQDGETVSNEVIYPMLSQPMGFHYGANFGVPGDGTYTVTLSVGAMQTRRTGDFVGKFTEPTSAEIQFEYSEQAKNEIMFERLNDRAGAEGAVEPMEMQMMPDSLAPAKDQFPGRVIGEAMSNDGQFVATVLDSHRKVSTRAARISRFRLERGTIR